MMYIFSFTFSPSSSFSPVLNFILFFTLPFSFIFSLCIPHYFTYPPLFFFSLIYPFLYFLPFLYFPSSCISFSSFFFSLSPIFAIFLLLYFITSPTTHQQKKNIYLFPIYSLSIYIYIPFLSIFPSIPPPLFLFHSYPPPSFPLFPFYFSPPSHPLLYPPLSLIFLTLLSMTFDLCGIAEISRLYCRKMKELTWIFTTRCNCNFFLIW